MKLTVQKSVTLYRADASWWGIYSDEDNTLFALFYNRADAKAYMGQLEGHCNMSVVEVRVSE